MVRKLLSIVLILICALGMSACSQKESVESNPQEDTLAFIEVDGKRIKNFKPETLKYDVILPNETLVQPIIKAENTNGISENVKYKYPDTIEGVYMIKYNGTIYELNLEYDKQPTALNNSYYRLTQDKELNIAYFGGSVTNGYGSSSDDKTWRAIVTNYLKSKFPQAKINAKNSAIGGTGTEFGAYRAVTDLQLETYTPDLVFVEFAVNDVIDSTNASDSKIYMETIIRTIYSYAPNADIVMVFITGSSSKGEDFEQLIAHKDVAKEYGLPCINVGKALCAELDSYLDMNFVDAKHPEWLKFFIDTVHPNDAGYAKYASYITGYLDKVFYSERKSEKIKPSYLPKESSSNILVKPEMFNAKGKTDISDFSVSDEGYLRTDKDGATLTVTFTGTSLKMWTFAGHQGSVLEYIIDDDETKSITLSKSSDNHKIYKLAEGLTDTKHTVKITFKKSTGLKVDIRNFLITGEKENKGFSITN